jgi:soluble lytic murein transglycosylase-like protein
MITCSLAYAQNYSGSGRKPPKKLSDRQRLVVKEIVKHIPDGVDPFEILAIGIVESNLTPRAVSHTGDYGVIQVNCRIHRKRLKREFGVVNCEKEMLHIPVNVKAGIRILLLFRNNYKQCRGRNAYACYNGGQGWKVRMNQCIEKNRCGAIEDKEFFDKCVRKCSRPARYQRAVLRAIRFLKREHKRKPLPI